MAEPPTAMLEKTSAFTAVLRVFFYAVFLSIPGGASVREQIVSCYDERLAVYIDKPAEHNGRYVFFIPAPGYMDHHGKVGLQNRSSVPEEGVIRVWKDFLMKSGYAVVQFDKPGTGGSSGRLSRQEETAFLCIFSTVDSLEGGLDGGYFIFTISSGSDFYRYALNSVRAAAGGRFPSGVVYLAGLPAWYTQMETGIPLFSVLGDTTLLTENIIKAGLRFQADWDTLSSVYIAPRTDALLCDLEYRTETGKCRIRQDIFDSVAFWMGRIPVSGKGMETPGDSLPGTPDDSL